MRYLTLNEVLELYRRIMEQSGGESEQAMPRWKRFLS